MYERHNLKYNPRFRARSSHSCFWPLDITHRARRLEGIDDRILLDPGRHNWSSIEIKRDR